MSIHEWEVGIASHIFVVILHELEQACDTYIICHAVKQRHRVEKSLSVFIRCCML